MAALPDRREQQKAGTAQTAPFARAATDSSTIIVPASAADLAAQYDLTISHPTVEQESCGAFERWLARAAAARGLSCALIHDGIIHESIRRLATGQLTIGLHLDYFALWHVQDDPYAQLAQAVIDAGGQSINPPARSRLFTDKAAAHAELLRAGFGVPETVVVRPWSPDRPLTTEEWRRLRLDERGAHVYVKPANGFGGQGVTRIEATTPDAVATAIATARNHDRRETYLVQREVRCGQLRCDDGIERPAYWRVLHCLGDFLAFWWDHHGPARGRPAYHEVTPADVLRHDLQPLYDAAEALADLCGLEWFSTEICLSAGREPSRFHVHFRDGFDRPLVVIDYVNDQCDVDVQSRWLGAPPDSVVKHVAERFAEAAARRSRALNASFVRLAA
jgi:hypothetical protein